MRRVALEQVTVVWLDNKGLSDQDERKAKEAEKYFLLSCFWQKMKKDLVLVGKIKCRGNRNCLLQKSPNDVIFLLVLEEIRQVKTSAITYKCLSCRNDITGTRLVAFASTAPWKTPAWIH